MHNLFANFVKILEVCKIFSQDLVNDNGNITRPGVVPKFSDLEVIALSLTAETMGIDSECYLFGKLQEYRGQMPNLISRRQFNDRRKLTAQLCEKIRKRIVYAIDGDEDYFIIDTKPVKVCQLAGRKTHRLGYHCTVLKPASPAQPGRTYSFSSHGAYPSESVLRR